MTRPAWKVAKMSGQEAGQRQYKERTNLANQISAGHYDFEEGKCFFCRSTKNKKKTGLLPLTGKIWWCNICGKETYDNERIFERTL